MIHNHQTAPTRFVEANGIQPRRAVPVAGALRPARLDVPVRVSSGAQMTWNSSHEE
jgi:hypothetical protein